LLVRPGHRQRNWPTYLLVLVWIVGTLAVAGPSWRREPSPFADDSTALVIVEKLTPSMLAGDLPPDRLTRAGQKIADLLKRRGRARTGFVVYAGSAHLVMPVTTDIGTITSFAAALQPDVMPKDGDDPAAALLLAGTLVKKAGGGSILLIADTIPPDVLTALAQQRRALGAPVTIFGLVPLGAAMHDLDAAAKALDATLIPITADDADIDALDGAIASTIDQAAAADAQAQWRDEGYWLMLIVMPLVLLWFRRGWVIAVRS
jgi:Ca-activated chloride channel family protein